MNETARPPLLLEPLAAHASRLITEEVDERYVYHNLQHTEAVVKAARALADDHGLSQADRLVVEAAAWFHDVGYTGGWQQHEERSARYATAWLTDHLPEDYPNRAGIIAGVTSAIRATRMPQAPTNLLDEIVADADLSHLGAPTYWDRCGRVRQEFNLTRDTIMSDQEWIDFELQFMLDHDYHTEAGRKRFGKRKEKHLRQLYKRKQKLHSETSGTPAPVSPAEQELADRIALRDSGKGKKDKGKKKKKKEGLDEKKIGRGVETMYRATYRTHVNLSSIADNKANIMLSVNAIILSISAANLFPKLDSNPHLTVPTIILVAVCLLSLFFAIQATRPKVTEGKSSLEDIQSRRSNLLFFGNFYNMELDDFHYGMKEMINDPEFLYSTMTRDLYYLGVVLAAKYRFLRICYNVFLFGLIVAVAAFIVAAIYYNMNNPSGPAVLVPPGSVIVPE